MKLAVCWLWQFPVNMVDMEQHSKENRFSQFTVVDTFPS